MERRTSVVKSALFDRKGDASCRYLVGDLIGNFDT